MKVLVMDKTLKEWSRSDRGPKQTPSCVPGPSSPVTPGPHVRLGLMTVSRSILRWEERRFLMTGPSD